jgi:hypothetical protein
MGAGPEIGPTDPTGRSRGRDRRRLKGTNHLPKIVAGVRFKDGIEVLEAPANHAA